MEAVDCQQQDRQGHERCQAHEQNYQQQQKHEQQLVPGKAAGTM